MSTANTPIFTCMACRVGFRDCDAQRNHYKTDWHRYNLKRKMADLAPITAADFRNKVIQQAEARAAPAVPVDDLKCVTCSKKFNSANAKVSHMESKKHKEAIKRNSSAAGKADAAAAAAMGRPADAAPATDDGGAPPARPAATASTTDAVSPVATEAVIAAPAPTPAAEAATVVPVALGTGMDLGGDEGDEVDPDDPDDLPEPEPDVVLTVEDCLFCTHRSESLVENLKHMNLAHGFYIPDVEYLVDLSGMVRYLGDKVSRYHICLLCNGRGKAFHSTEAVRNHMCGKGHCFVEYEEQGQIELEEFYDFKPSWDAYYAKHGKQPAVAAADDGDSDWEDVDGDDDAGDGMETEGASAPDAKQALVATDEAKIEGQMVALYKAGRTVEIEGLDMVLPSGARIGHRSMRRYYKQKFATEDLRDSVVIQKLVSEHNAIGLPGFGSGAPTKEARRDRDLQTKYFHQQNLKRSIYGNTPNIAHKFFREQNTQ